MIVDSRIVDALRLAVEHENAAAWRGPGVEHAIGPDVELPIPPVSKSITKSRKTMKQTTKEQIAIAARMGVSEAAFVGARMAQDDPDDPFDPALDSRGLDSAVDVDQNLQDASDAISRANSEDDPVLRHAHITAAKTALDAAHQLSAEKAQSRAVHYRMK